MVRPRMEVSRREEDRFKVECVVREKKELIAKWRELTMEVRSKYWRKWEDEPER